MYISPVDKLGISLDELMALDSKGLIRIEKKLKVQRLQRKEEVYNPQQFDELLDQLAEPEKKKSILFVEKHSSLKKFISTGADSGIKTFVLDAVDLKNTPFLKDFLAPYFDAYFMKLVKRDYRSNKYDTILKAMQYKDLFTDKLLTQYYEYITAQVAIVVEKINIAKKGELASKCPQIAYKTFVQLMNTVPLGFIKKTKVAYIDAMVDYYNKTLNRHAEFNKIKRSFQNFKEIEVGDQELLVFINKLSSQITNTSTYNNQSHSNNTSSSSSSWKTVAMVIGILIFVIRVARIFTRNSSSYKSSTSNTYDLPTITTSYDKDKTAFYSDLIHKASGDTIRNYSSSSIKTNGNSYPLQFQNVRRTNTSFGYTIPVKNNRESSLVIFLESASYYKYRAKSLTTKDSTELFNVLDKSTLVFYAGQDFVAAQSAGRIISTRNGISLKPSKRYFKDVSDVELKWLKNKYVIDSVGNNPSIELLKNQLVFKNISYHTIPHRILPPEKEEVIEETVVESSSSLETRAIRSAWKSPKNKFLLGLVANGLTHGEVKLLENGENPYPNTFKGIRHNSITGYDVEVTNNSDDDLVVFSRNLQLERDQAVFVSRQKKIVMLLHDENDTLYFYKGKKFKKGNELKGDSVFPDGYFSEFKAYKLLSKYHAVKGLGGDPSIEINNTGVIFNEIEYQSQ